MWLFTLGFLGRDFFNQVQLSCPRHNKQFPVWKLKQIVEGQFKIK